jgi:hypothetical protein
VWIGGESAAEVAQLQELLGGQGSGHRLGDMACVPGADLPLCAGARLAESDPACPPVVGVADALDEPGGLQPRDQP